MGIAPSVRRQVKAWPVAIALVVLAGASCTKETIIFRDRDLFNPPPDASVGFLGYFDPAGGKTTCGNCHAEKQAVWENTAHAGAYDALVGSGGAQGFCYGCHTVSELGNVIDTTAGWNALQTADSVVDVPEYHDVQCESCHGPGLEHVAAPGLVQPLASIAADTAATNGCGECHRDTHHPFVEQWQESRHGSPSALSYAGGRDGCNQCHEGRKALEVKFGESSNYVERDGSELQPFTCAVCHDPHGSPNDAQLRAPIDVASTDHLCVTCHSRNATPPSFRGPHAAQGLLVLGTNAGWIPPGFVYDTSLIVSSHGTTANQKLCATCHVAQIEVTDAATGDFVFQSVGHTFEAIPCQDNDGLPIAGPCSVPERNFSACAGSGCHTSEAGARSAFQVVRARLDFLMDQLWADTNGDDSINAGDGGLLPQVVAMGDTSQLNLRDDLVTVAEGALWNASLAFTSTRPKFGEGYVFGSSFSAHKTSGDGVHNPFLLEALLIASIEAVRDEYNLAPPMGDLTIRAAQPPSVRRLR